MASYGKEALPGGWKPGNILAHSYCMKVQGFAVVFLLVTSRRLSYLALLRRRCKMPNYALILNISVSVCLESWAIRRRRPAIPLFTSSPHGKRPSRAPGVLRLLFPFSGRSELRMARYTGP